MSPQEIAQLVASLVAQGTPADVIAATVAALQPQNEPSGVVVEATEPKRTKSGAIDKRTKQGRAAANQDAPKPREYKWRVGAICNRYGVGEPGSTFTYTNKNGVTRSHLVTREEDGIRYSVPTA